MSAPELEGGTLLLMASNAFKGRELPDKVALELNEAMARNMRILVGEATGCRGFQDHLHRARYPLVTVGHMRKVRYNAGDWPTQAFGDDLEEKELRMIEECDSAIVIWVNKSGVIARNIQSLKKQYKPVFLYECWTDTSNVNSGWVEYERA